MTKIIGTITDSGTVTVETIRSHEHHKIDLVVTDYSSTISVKIEDLSNKDEVAINCDPNNTTYTLNSNGAESFVIENMRLGKLRVNVLSGGGTINCYYDGW